MSYKGNPNSLGALVGGSPLANVGINPQQSQMETFMRQQAAIQYQQGSLAAVGAAAIQRPVDDSPNPVLLLLSA